MRTGADASEEGIFRVRCPASEDDTVNAERGDGEHVEHTDVDVGNDHWHSEQSGAEGQHREHKDRRDHRELRCDVKVEFVDAIRDEILLEQELERVSDGLTESEQRDILLESQEGQRDTDAVGAHAVLNKRADLAFGVNGVGNKTKDDTQQHERLKKRGPDQKHLGLERVGGEIGHRRKAFRTRVDPIFRVPCSGAFTTLGNLGFI